MASEDGGCQIIMLNGALLPGMRMPVLGPPPPDPHPNPVVQRMREAWDLRVIAWYAGPGHRARREVVDRWTRPDTERAHQGTA